MFDHFRASSNTLSPRVWLDNSALPFTVQVVERTGELSSQNRIHHANGLTFRLTESKTHPEGLRPILSGSPHIYHNHGKDNADDFGLADLKAVFGVLADRYGVNPSAFELQSLEVGINMLLPDGIPVAHVLASIVTHRDKRFTKMQVGKRKQSIGLRCERSDYQIKIYDKNKQQGRKGKHLLRVEVKVLKMRALKRFEIAALSDLMNPAKVGPLGEWLASFVADIVFIEPGSINKTQLTERQLLDLERWRNPINWERWDYKKRNRQKIRFREFMQRYANSTLQNDLCEAINETWEYLTNRKQETGRCFHRLSEPSEADERGMFSPFIWTVKTSPGRGVNLPPKDSLKIFAKNGRSYPHTRSERIQKRQCISCGWNISHQKKGSLFCSERDRGKAAKACRNVDSNRRRTLSRRIMKAKTQDTWLVIHYRENGQLYSDTLHASEVSAQGPWLNLVESVERLDQEPPHVLNSKEARQLLQKLTRANVDQDSEAYQSRSTSSK